MFGAFDAPPTHGGRIPFRDLTRRQADGWECIVCRAAYDVPPAILSVPVGVAADGGGQVFACNTAKCAGAVGYVAPEQLPLGGAL